MKMHQFKLDFSNYNVYLHVMSCKIFLEVMINWHWQFGFVWQCVFPDTSSNFKSKETNAHAVYAHIQNKLGLGKRKLSNLS